MNRPRGTAPKITMMSRKDWWLAHSSAPPLGGRCSRPSSRGRGGVLHTKAVGLQRKGAERAVRWAFLMQAIADAEVYGARWMVSLDRGLRRDLARGRGSGMETWPRIVQTVRGVGFVLRS